MNHNHDGPGVYDVTVTITFQAYLRDPGDDEGTVEEAALLLERGEIVPEVETEHNQEATREHVATMKAEYYATT